MASLLKSKNIDYNRKVFKIIDNSTFHEMLNILKASCCGLALGFCCKIRYQLAFSMLTSKK